MKSQRTSVRDHFTAWFLRKRGMNHSAADLPTLDELPKADISDLVEAGQYQSTVDRDFES